MRPPAKLAFLLCACLIAFLPCTAAAADREPRIPVQDMIAMELLTVEISTTAGAPVVLLREPDSGDTIPVVIGPVEARAILMALHGVEAPRPMTHDLISGILGATGARLERILIDDLIEGTYIGALELRMPAGERLLYVDARPSDGLAIAVRENAAILVAPAILEAARIQLPEQDDRLASTSGLIVSTVTAALRERFALGDRNGVLVRRSEGVAAAAGIPPGALITAVNGATPASAEEFLALMEQVQTGETVDIAYWMEGREHSVTLAREPAEAERIQRAQPKLQV
jgi:bifunctional DNase/RNase